MPSVRHSRSNSRSSLGLRARPLNRRSVNSVPVSGSSARVLNGAAWAKAFKKLLTVAAVRWP